MSCGLENSVIVFFNLVPTLVAGAKPSLFWESGNLFNPGSISLANYTLFIKKKKNAKNNPCSACPTRLLLN